MSYSSTGYNSCVITPFVTGSCHTITIYSVTGKKDFNYINDFLNAFTLTQQENILNNTDTYTTEYSATNDNGDEIYYDIDITSTFTHTLTANQDNTNEKATVILVVNPLIKGIHDIYYQSNTYIEEIPTTQQIILTTNTVDKNNVINAVTAITEIDLKHAYLQDTYTVFSGVSLKNTFLGGGSPPGSSLFYTNARADIVIDEDFIYSSNPEEANVAYRVIGDKVSIKFTLERIKFGLQRYLDTGNYVEIPFGISSYKGTQPKLPDSDIQFFKNSRSQTLTFKVSDFPIPTTNEKKFLQATAMTYLQYKTSGSLYECLIPIYVNNIIFVDNIKQSPKIYFAEVDKTDSDKINVYIKNGGININYNLYVAGQLIEINGTQPISIDGSSLKEGTGFTTPV